MSTTSSSPSEEVQPAKTTETTTTTKASTSSSRITLSNHIPIYYQNIRSVPAKIDLYQKLETTLYDIICMTETWFTAAHKTETYIPQRFTVHRMDRSSTNSEFNRAGGVAILVDNKFQSTRHKQFESDEIEGLCVEVKLNRKSIVIYLAYIPELESGRDAAFKQHTKCIEQLLLKFDADVIVMGDFNMRGVKWNQVDDSNALVPNNIPSNDKHGFRDFLHSMQLLSLSQLVHISNDAGNYLDLIFTRNESALTIFHAMNTLTNIKQTDSPHPPIEIIVTTYTVPSQQTIILKCLHTQRETMNE